MRAGLLHHIVVVVVAALHAAACTSSARSAVSARPTTRSAHSAAASRPALPRLDAARLRYGLAVARAALARWPWAAGAADNTCIQLYAEQAQWLLRCEGHAPTSFRRTGQRFAAQPVYVDTQPVTFYGRTIPYAKISVPLVASVGWYQPTLAGSAMYRGRPWFVIQSLDALVENHPAFGSATRTEAWLAIFVHELFHLPQLSHAAVRAFLAAHRDGWRKNPGNRLKQLFASKPAYAAAIRADFAPLAAAVTRRDALDAGAARAVLRRWLVAHRARQRRFAARLGFDQLALWEDFELFVEGLARHIENSFVIDPARHPGAARALRDDPRYRAFADLEGKLYIYPKYGRMRASTWFYELGAHLARLLERASGPTWRRNVLKAPGFLVGAVKAAVERNGSS